MVCTLMSDVTGPNGVLSQLGLNGNSSAGSGGSGSGSGGSGTGSGTSTAGGQSMGGCTTSSTDQTTCTWMGQTVTPQQYEQDVAASGTGTGDTSSTADSGSSGGSSDTSGTSTSGTTASTGSTAPAFVDPTQDSHSGQSDHRLSCALQVGGSGPSVAGCRAGVSSIEITAPSVQQVQQTVNGVVSTAKTDVNNTVDTAATDVGGAVTTAETDINGAVNTAQTDVNNTVNTVATDVGGAVTTAETDVNGAVNVLKNGSVNCNLSLGGSGCQVTP
jgi:hypothetical protein